MNGITERNACSNINCLQSKEIVCTKPTRRSSWNFSTKHCLCLPTPRNTACDRRYRIDQLRNSTKQSGFLARQKQTSSHKIPSCKKLPDRSDNQTITKIQTLLLCKMTALRLILPQLQLINILANQGIPNHTKSERPLDILTKAVNPRACNIRKDDENLSPHFHPKN